MKQTLLIASLAVLLAACGDDTPQSDKEMAAAKKVAACQIGGQPGPGNCSIKSCMAIIWGKSIEQAVDENERRLGAQNAQKTMENGAPGVAATWKGCKTSGSIIPANYYQTRDGQYCREYVLAVHIVHGDTNFERHGIACREPGGLWKSVPQK